MRYRPNFKVSVPSNNYIYSIADENSSGVQPRNPVVMRKPCFDDQVEACTVEKRIEERVKSGKYFIKKC